MPANLERNQQVRDETQKSWDWVRGLSEYRGDYRKQQNIMKRIEKGEISGLQSGLIQMSLRNGRDEMGKKTWCGETRNEFFDRWGFFPLVNPDQKGIPYPLFEFVTQKMRKDPIRLTDLVNFSRQELFGLANIKTTPQERKQWSKPSVLRMDIHYEQPIAHVLKAIKDDLKLIHKAYGIEAKRPQPAMLYHQCQSYYLKKLAKSDSEIENVIFPKQDSAEARRKKTKRLLESVTN